MATTYSRVKGPGVKILESSLKSISEFDHFKHSLVFHLRQDTEFRPYLKKDATWGSKSISRPYRDLVDDPGRSNDPATGQTAEEKCEIVVFLLDSIACFLPLIPTDDILKCGSLNAVWKLIRIHSNIEATGSLLNGVWNVTRQPDESPQALSVYGRG